MSATVLPSRRIANRLGRGLWLAALFAGSVHAQQAPPPSPPSSPSPSLSTRDPAQPAAPPACPEPPHYPLPNALGALRDISTHLEELSQDARCLKDANYHAYRGAVLMALGRPVEAIEPLERALLTEPDLIGAQLDLAQAHAMEGDTASAVALLEDLRGRAELPTSALRQIEREIAALRAPAAPAGEAASTREARAAQGRWQSSWQVSAMGGVDSNLNNAPSATELTLTLPQGNVTLPLDPASRPRGGGAVIASAQWQGLRVDRESVWVLQADGRTRNTGDPSVDYQQLELAANWLQAPLAPRQWVGRVGASYFRFAGVTLLWATRASIQYQWEGIATGLGGIVAHCRPTAGVELERRLYPSSRSIDGFYRGAALGLLCRPASDQPVAPPVFTVQARYGEELPVDDARPGGTYRRAEVRAQWEGRIPWMGGQFALRWSSTEQDDSAPYSVLLGSLPRRTLRHTGQIETSWPLKRGLSLITSIEGTRQSSNLAAFASRQAAAWVGVRFESL
ncbi:MAG TPA: tetratricopeptide repeat protein [Ramlibacter sp.]|uniref:tetratricopeptide repeat protein n=1 Tax=Ramlibacter sp. TaxID=1917967 RepID=UPI002B572FAE|nr:tetratricopeptide repeat protein [Ramlibacter sp.]HVZ42280.1 tetratricopeptide repeat protein [Ramlibacter sp.]